MLGERLPRSFQGYPSHFARETPEDAWVAQSKDDGLINHRIEFYTIQSFFESRIGFNPHETPIPADWLLFSEQGLLEVTGGKIFYVGLNQLHKIQEKFKYYPDSVWRYLLAAQWRRIGQEDHLMGRAGYVDDEIGARIIASRLIRDIMRLCFLMEKEYAPYPKWFGTAFKKLNVSNAMQPLLLETLESKNWETRDLHWSHVCELAVEYHNQLNITESIDARVQSFHGLPFSSIGADEISNRIRETINDKDVRDLPSHLGSIDQFSDSTDLLSYPKLKKKIKNVYYQ